MTTHNVYNVQDYGCVGDNSTDNTTNLATANAAAAATGGQLYFPNGIYITQPQVHYANVVWQGESRASSVVKLKNGSNADLLVSDGFATNTGTTNIGIQGFGLRHITLDANQANQTALSRCWVVYGWQYEVDDVWFVNGFGGGVYSEWNNGANPSECMWSNFKIWNYGGKNGCKGLEYKGPHDSVFVNGVVATQDSRITYATTGNPTYGATPINGTTGVLPTAGTSFTFATTSAASTVDYPTSGGKFIVYLIGLPNPWTLVTYTSCATVGAVTTFSGCTAPQGGQTIPIGVGTQIQGNPTYGIYQSAPDTGMLVSNVHTWGRNHFGVYYNGGNGAGTFNNCIAEGAFVANVVFDNGGCAWVGGAIYGTNGQSGQNFEGGLQIGQTNNTAACNINTNIYNCGSSGGGWTVNMAHTAGANHIFVNGSCGNGNSQWLVKPYYGGDFYLMSNRTNQGASIFSTMQSQAQFPGGLYGLVQLNVYSQTSTNYTLSWTDQATENEFTASTPVTVTVPPHSSVAYPVGTVMNLRQMGAGQVTVTPGSGVTINSPHGMSTNTRYSTITLINNGTDTWVLNGDTA